MKKLLLATLIGLSFSATANATTEVMCHFDSFYASPSNTPKNVTSSHNVKIINTTNQIKYYSISYQMFMDKNIIAGKDINVSVQPHQIFIHNIVLNQYRIFTQKRNFDASCRTTIMGDEQNQISGGGYIRIM